VSSAMMVQVEPEPEYPRAADIQTVSHTSCRERRPYWCAILGLKMYPNDFEVIEIGMLSAQAVKYRGLPYDPVRRSLFGDPVAISLAATAGSAHALAVGAARLATYTTASGCMVGKCRRRYVRQELHRRRCEGRFATSVLQPRHRHTGSRRDPPIPYQPGSATPAMSVMSVRSPFHEGCLSDPRNSRYSTSPMRTGRTHST
jgi:hypothetical protein